MTLRKRWRKKAPRDPRNVPITRGCLVRLLRDVPYSDGRLVMCQVCRVSSVGMSGVGLWIDPPRLDARFVLGVRFDAVEVVPKGTRVGPPTFGDMLRMTGKSLREMLR